MSWLSKYYQYKALIQNSLDTGVTTDELDALGYTKWDSVNNELLANGVVVSGTYTVDDYTDIPTASTNTDLNVVVRNMGVNTAYYNSIPLHSDGTAWSILGGECLFASYATQINFISPAATFTSATATSINGGTDIRLTSAGAHGLTSAVAVGKKIYVSAGINWTPGPYTIKTIAVDTSGLVIDLEEPFVASMGSPTIALAGTEFTPFSFTLPPLQSTSHIRWDVSFEFPVASTSTKRTKIVLGSTEFANVNHNGASTLMDRFTGGVSNESSTSVNRSWFTLAATSGVGTGTGSGSVAGAEDTSSAKTVSIKLTMGTANDVLAVNRWAFWLKY